MRLNSAFAKPIGKFAAGSALSQVIVALSIPIVARIYDPIVLGSFLILDAFCDIFAYGATLALDKAIYVTRSARGVRDLIAATLISISLVAMLAGALFWAAIKAGLVPEMLAQTWLVLAVIVVVWCRGAYYLFQSLTIRASRFGTLVLAENLRAATLVAGRIGLGLKGFGFAGLVVSSVLGAAIAAIALTRRTWADLGRARRNLGAAQFLRTLKRHRERILYEGGGQFLSQFPMRGPVFVITIFFTAAGAGIYAIGFLLAYRPVELIVRSTTEVLRASIAQHIRDGNLPEARRLGIALIQKLTLSALFTSFSVATLVYLTEGILFPPEWKGVGAVCLANALFVAGLLVLRPVQIIFSLYGRQRMSLVLEGSAVVACFGAIVIGGSFGASLEVVCLLSGLAMVGVLLPLALVALSTLKAA
ncbi:MAG: hypothetical protein AAGJ74_04205 [Pseudomonadota bacterium]